MPWTVSDVERHNSGLTDAQKRQWVRVANDALRRCQSQGGSNCEASAIRQANAAVQRNSNNMKTQDLLTYSISVNNYQIREEILQGRPHIVVPVVMMREGVHSGSDGPQLHREEELSAFPQAWNGIPVVIYHPKENGRNISANDPQVMERHAVGQIFNAHYDNGLKAEAWIDVQRILAISPEALAHIREGRPLDVSIGSYTDVEATTGQWHDETYESIASNYMPDHLALLPGEQGACSWEDGCGVRVNQKKGGDMKDLLKSFKELVQKGYSVSLVNNEEGFQEISQLIQSALDAMDTNSKMHFLEEVYSDDFVYRIRTLEGNSTLYRRGYSISDGTVNMADDPVEVRKQVSYVTAKRMVRTKPSVNSKTKGGNMPGHETPCCEAKVDQLIVNKLSQFEAKDKEWLMTLEESQLDKLVPKEPEPTANAAEAIKTFRSTLKTLEDFAALMPEDMGKRVLQAEVDRKAKREALVKSITDNSEKFEKETLQSLDDKTLQGIADSVTKKSEPANYSGQGPSDFSADGDEMDEDPMLPAGFEEKGEDK